MAFSLPGLFGSFVVFHFFSFSIFILRFSKKQSIYFIFVQLKKVSVHPLISCSPLEFIWDQYLLVKMVMYISVSSAYSNIFLCFPLSEPVERIQMFINDGILGNMSFLPLRCVITYRHTRFPRRSSHLLWLTVSNAALSSLNTKTEIPPLTVFKWSSLSATVWLKS